MPFLVEEADVEDDAGNVIKEVYVQPVAPLEFDAGCRLGSEDPEISNGGENDRYGWVCPRMWPQAPIPVVGQLPGPADHPPVWQLKLPVEVPIAS